MRGTAKSDYELLQDEMRQLKRENAALREERDSYRLRAEQNWGLRKEIQSALNVSFDCEGEEALKQGLAAINDLRADKERLDWLDAVGYLRKNVNMDGVWKEWEISTDETELTLRSAIDAARNHIGEFTEKGMQP